MHICIFRAVMWYNCANRIQLAPQLFFVILNLFRNYFMQMKLTCVCCVLKSIFKFALPCLFLKLWLYLLLNMKNSGNNYERAERKEKEKQKIIFNRKKKFVRDHSFMTPAEKVKIRTPLSLRIYKHPILVWAPSTLRRP